MLEGAPDREKDEIPLFFEKLSESDQSSYHTLRGRVASPDDRYTRFRRLITLQECFDEIHSFCIHHDANDSLRCLVCGIFWFESGELAINTRQLRILLAKSKSSINGTLAKMKYITLPTKDRERDRLIDALPALKGDWLEVRQWTIRRSTSVAPEQPGWPELAPLTEIAEPNWEFDDLDFDGVPFSRDEIDASLGSFLQFCSFMPGVSQPSDLLRFDIDMENKD
jgi:hypothetical protein